MQSQYIPLLVLFGVVAVMVAAMVTLSTVLGPHRYRPAKHDIFECGSRPLGSSRQRFSVKFYLVALLFLLFDIEAVFLFPWAVLYRSLSVELGALMLVEMVVFIGMLSVGLVYVYRRGALDWD